MAYLEFIHNLVETMDKYFENVCELDVSSLKVLTADHVQFRESALYHKRDDHERVYHRDEQAADSE